MAFVMSFKDVCFAASFKDIYVQQGLMSEDREFQMYRAVNVCQASLVYMLGANSH